MGQSRHQGAMVTEVPGQVPVTFRFHRGDPDQPKQAIAPGGLTILDERLPLKPPRPVLLGVVVGVEQLRLAVIAQAFVASPSCARMASSSVVARPSCKYSVRACSPQSGAVRISAIPADACAMPSPVDRKAITS